MITSILDGSMTLTMWTDLRIYLGKVVVNINVEHGQLELDKDYVTQIGRNILVLPHHENSYINLLVAVCCFSVDSHLPTI